MKPACLCRGFFMGLVVFVLCGSIADAKIHSGDGKVLYVYNWWNYFGKDTLKEFERRYGVTVVYDEYKSNEEMMNKLISGGDSVYDVVFPTAQYVDILVKMGMLEELNHKNIPNRKGVKPDLLNLDFDPHNQYSLPYQWCSTVVAYRRDKVVVKADSLSVVFDPSEKNKGKIGVVDSMREIIGAALLYNGYSMNSTRQSELAVARNTLLHIKPYVRAVETDLINGLVSGDIVVAITWRGEVLYSKNPNIDYFIPSEGAMLGFDSMVIPKKAPHKGLAHQFINYLLEPKVSAAISNYTYYSSPVVSASDYINDKRIRTEVRNPANKVFDTYDYLSGVGPAISMYNKIWMEFRQ